MLTVQPGEVHGFGEFSINNNTAFGEYIDGTNYQTTNFNPFTTYPGAFLSLWSGETVYQETDMPGLVNTPSLYANIGVEGLDNVIRPEPAALANNQIASRTQNQHRYSQSAITDQPSQGSTFSLWTNS